jgi:iron complex outermembrane receptor protein
LVPYVEALETHRIDGGFVAKSLVKNKYLWSARAALSNANHRHQFGEITERDRHRTTFVESTLRIPSGSNMFVVGAALEGENYRGQDVPQWDFNYWTPGAFGQADIQFNRSVLLSASARVDHHNVYGTFFSPRVSLLLRRGAWSSRASVGSGFFGHRR